MENIKILPIRASDTHPLRQKILRPHQPIQEMEFPGDNDPETFHYGLFIENILMGIASVYKENTPGNEIINSYRLRGMAVEEKLRGKGFGKILVNKIFEELKEKDAEYLWCNARTNASGFYETLGFKIEGNEFDIPEIGPHYLMIKKV